MDNILSADEKKTAIEELIKVQSDPEYIAAQTAAASVAVTDHYQRVIVGWCNNHDMNQQSLSLSIIGTVSEESLRAWEASLTEKKYFVSRTETNFIVSVSEPKA